MKNKITFLKEALFGFGFIILSSSGCPPKELPPQCCPIVTAFEVRDPWVCPENCPGGGKTRLEYKIEFWRENELCEPPEEFTVSIKNLTDNVNLPTQALNNPQVGIYSGVQEITLKKDTEYELKAKGGDKVCIEGSKTLKVDVVNQGDFHEICFSGKLDPPNCTFSGGPLPFGPGVLIDNIYNPNLFNIRVDKDNLSEFIGSKKNGWALSDKEATGKWSIGLPDGQDCMSYSNLPEPDQKLCVIVFLKCTCPPQGSPK